MIAISKLIKLLFGVFTKPIAAKAKGLSKSKDGVIRKILLNMGRGWHRISFDGKISKHKDEYFIDKGSILLS